MTPRKRPLRARARRAPRSITAAAALSATALGLTSCDLIGIAKETRELTTLSSPGLVDLTPLAESYSGWGPDHLLVESMADHLLHERVDRELTSGEVSFDVVALDGTWVPGFAEDLRPLDHLYTSEVRSDLFPGVLQGAQVGGSYVGMPAWVDSDVLFYRTDLFEDEAEQDRFEEEYGYRLGPPADWEQYRDVAEFFTRDTDDDGDTDLYGTDLKGGVETDWLAAVSQAGAEAIVLGGDRVTINDAEHVAALEFYRRLLPYAPPGASRLDAAGARILFLQGSLAMMRFRGSAYPQIPGNSPVTGKVGVAPMIAGPGGVAGVLRAVYLAVPRAAPYPETGIDFLAHAFEHNELLIGTPPRLPARVSVFEAYAEEEGFEHYAALLETLNSPLSRPLPATPEWQEIVEMVLIPTVQRALEGDSESQALLDEAKTQIEAILQQQ